MRKRTIDKIWERYGGVSNPTKKEEFIYVEAEYSMIYEHGDIESMIDLGDYYYRKREFHLAQKYYEMALPKDFFAERHLGYIWYYGRTGNRDYKRAYELFQRAMKHGSYIGTYMIAQMYRNGYYLPKDVERYESMLEELYERIKLSDEGYLQDGYDFIVGFWELPIRIATIRYQKGRDQEAVRLYLGSRKQLASALRFQPFWGDLYLMQDLIDALYEIIPFDERAFDFYDLYYLLKRESQVRFRYKDRLYEIHSRWMDGDYAVCFHGRWFRNRSAFFEKAEIEGEKLTTICERFTDWELLYG